MPNVNSFADVIGLQNAGQPIVVASTKTLHQTFNLGSSAALLTVPNPAALVVSGAEFPGLSAGARPFVVRAAGKVLGGQPYQIDIVLGSDLNQELATTGLSANGLASDNWFLQMTAMWDPDSLRLRGVYDGWAGAFAVARQTIQTNLQPASLAALTFSVALTIPSANANASFALTTFEAEWA